MATNSDYFARPIEPSSLTEPTSCHTAHFATCWLRPDIAVVTAHGEIDAANAREFVEYALRHSAQIKRLVIDLAGVEFFGTAGFSALHALNVRAAGGHIHWALAPSVPVTRLLRICDPDSTLPICESVEAALSAAAHDESSTDDATAPEPKPLLQLVAQPR